MINTILCVLVYAAAGASVSLVVMAMRKSKTKCLIKTDGITAHLKEMNEKRELPTGMTAFEEWSDRIISGTLLPADPDSQKFALATMLMHLSPTTDHETDGHFIKALRKAAVNQIAHAKMTEIKDRVSAKKKDLETKGENHLQAVPSNTSTTAGV